LLLGKVIIHGHDDSLSGGWFDWPNPLWLGLLFSLPSRFLRSDLWLLFFCLLCLFILFNQCPDLPRHLLPA
jgi:hypothetical protein